MDAIDTVSPLQTRQHDVAKFHAPQTQFMEKVTSFKDSLTTLDETKTDVSQKDAAKADAMKKLQSMFISQMLGELFSEQTESTFGEGPQGEFYASAFSDAIAKQMAERDLFHFGKMLSDK